MAIGPAFFPEIPSVPGVTMASLAAGVKYANRRDLVLFALAEGSTMAGVFTQNAFCAAPVHIAKDHLAQGGGRYWLINTGYANAGTGQAGHDAAVQCCDALAERLNVQTSEVLPFSTGVIGELLPADRVIAGQDALIEQLRSDAWRDVATGIMTTDTRPKGACRQISIGDQRITIAGVSKGAGMICPNMATMLGFVVTDACVTAADLQALIGRAADQSFNRITVDGDTSTNDALVIGATGKTGELLVPGSADWGLFEQAVLEVTQSLAEAIIKDGEGVTKFVTIHVEQGRDEAECQQVARVIAHSPLVKTALFASDPNWGRILAAVGRAGLPDLDVEKVTLYLGDVCIVAGGSRATSYTEAAGQQVMDQEAITIRVLLGRGDANSWVWTTDFSHEYVTINAEYRS